MLGASASFTSGVAFSTQFATYGNDLYTDPWLAATANPQQITGSSGVATWTLQFPPTSFYPAGVPVPISSIVFINRCDNGLNTRINTTTPGTMSLISPNGTVLSVRNIPSLSVSVWNFPNMAQAGPIFPNSSLSTAPAATFQASNQNLLTYVRYINISSVLNKCLAFRELYALDNTITNVALYKPTSQSNLTYFDPAFGGFTSISSYGTDGIIDQDGPAGNMVNLGCSGVNWWQVDLGGVYNLSRIIIFNRFPLTNPTTVGQALGSNMAGATLTYYNGFGSFVGSYTLTGDMIQSIPVVLVPYTPTVTPSSTASLTVGATPSTTATGSWTPTNTPTPTTTQSAPLLPYAYQVTISTVATAQALNFVEVRVVVCGCAAASVNGILMAAVCTFCCLCTTRLAPHAAAICVFQCWAGPCG